MTIIKAKKDILDLVCKDCIDYHKSIKEIPDCTQCEYCRMKQYYKNVKENANEATRNIKKDIYGSFTVKGMD